MLWVNDGELAQQLLASWAPTATVNELPDEFTQRAAVVEAGLRMQSMLTGDVCTPLATAIRAFRQLNAAAVAAKHHGHDEDGHVEETPKPSMKKYGMMRAKEHGIARLAQKLEAPRTGLWRFWRRQPGPAPWPKARELQEGHASGRDRYWRSKPGIAPWPKEEPKRMLKMQLSEVSTAAASDEGIVAEEGKVLAAVISKDQSKRQEQKQEAKDDRTAEEREDDDDESTGNQDEAVSREISDGERDAQRPNLTVTSKAKSAASAGEGTGRQAPGVTKRTLTKNPEKQPSPMNGLRLEQSEAGPLRHEDEATDAIVAALLAVRNGASFEEFVAMLPPDVPANALVQMARAINSGCKEPG